MSYCINPHCPNSHNTDDRLFCQACGSELLLEGCYRVIKHLGSGGFGKTFEVSDSGRIRVLKILSNNHPKSVELFQQEAQVLQRLNHAGIPSVEPNGYFIYFPRDSREGLHCLVMEKIAGMNLEEYIIERSKQPISERAALRWLHQIVEILREVHQQQYFHRDIKPSNIMLKPDGQLALIDFGTAREVTQTFMHKVAGQQVTGIFTPGFTPPEQINGKAVPESDFFALGRTFVYLLTGKSPNEFTEDPRTGKLIWRDSANKISKKFADLIDYLMEPFPGNRPKDTQVILREIHKIDPSTKGELQIVQNSLSPQNRVSLAYSGLIRRFFAVFIDAIVIAPLVFVASLIWYGLSAAMSYKWAIIILFFVTWLYFTLSESSIRKGTLGKRILRIAVVDLKGNKISFIRANGRFFGKIFFIVFALNYYGLGLINFIFPCLTKKKRSLHDILFRTVVVQKRSLSN